MIGHDIPSPRPGGSLSISIFRSSAMEETPALSIYDCPARSASARRFKFSPGKVVGLGGPNEPPLWEMAPWNNPLASGDAHSMLTAIPPADSPKIVTLLGSPPKLAIFFCTHLRPAIISRRP